MKKFKKQEIGDLLNQVYREEISFTRMVEILNERVSERVSEAGGAPAELKEGDIAIFWNLDKWEAFVGKYNGLLDNGSSFPHQDHRGNRWVNAIKFESKEQFNRLINGEI